MSGKKRKSSGYGRNPGSDFLALPIGSNIWKYNDISNYSHPRISKENQVYIYYL